MLKGKQKEKGVFLVHSGGNVYNCSRCTVKETGRRVRKGRKKSVIAGLFASGLRQLRLNYAFLIIVFLVGFVGLYIVTQSQFQNAQLAGSEVAARLARDLENQGMKHQFALDNAA